MIGEFDEACSSKGTATRQKGEAGKGEKKPHNMKTPFLGQIEFEQWKRKLKKQT